MGAYERVIEKLESVAGSGSDLVTLWRETGPLLAEAVPHFEAACFFTVDPASLLTTSHFQEGRQQARAVHLCGRTSSGARWTGWRAFELRMPS